MAATSQPKRHNNAITAFTIWGNTFAGSRWGRINSLGRATYGRLPLNSQGVPSKLPLGSGHGHSCFLTIKAHLIDLIMYGDTKALEGGSFFESMRTVTARLPPLLKGSRAE